MSRILLIEDNKTIREVLRDTLEDDGYEVFEAENGLKGIRLLETQQVDLVISDILMPEKEGLETIAEIRRNTPNVKIIAISGGGRTGNLVFLEVARHLGADATLAKPFTPDKLLSAVRHHTL